MKVIGDIATVLNTTVDYLLNHADIHSMETCQKGGFKAEQHLDELVWEVTDLFAGGQLIKEDALERAMRALSNTYLIAKVKKKKYC